MTTKRVYLYDELSGVFLGEYLAQESPMEPGKFIVPDKSTDISPPACGLNEVAIFTAGAWAVTANHIGQTWYDTATGDPVIITALGKPAANLIQQKPVIPPVPPTTAELSAKARADRDALIAKVEWRYTRHAREVRLGLPLTDDIAVLDVYVQALADITKQFGFPGVINWPIPV